jgi:hypothetical protein
MERSEHFKRAAQVVKDLEQQLLKCDETSLLLDAMCETTTRQVEEHFEKCLTLLAARKATLLDDIDKRWHAQSISCIHYTTDLY